MKPKTLCCVGALCLGSAQWAAAQIAINFDTDTDSKPIDAPALFQGTTFLSELYAPWGVHFAGPNSNDGGAILSDGRSATSSLGTFGVLAHSGRQFLAFNRGFEGEDNFAPLDPETITFDRPMARVSIYAHGGNTPNTFLMEAFDASGNLLDSSRVSNPGLLADYSQLLVESRFDIKSIRLTGGSSASFVFDDLSADFSKPVPEASTWTMLGFGLPVVLAVTLLRGRARARELPGR